MTAVPPGLAAAFLPVLFPSFCQKTRNPHNNGVSSAVQSGNENRSFPHQSWLTTAATDYVCGSYDTSHFLDDRNSIGFSRDHSISLWRDLWRSLRVLLPNWPPCTLAEVDVLQTEHFILPRYICKVPSWGNQKMSPSERVHRQDFQPRKARKLLVFHGMGQSKATWVDRWNRYKLNNLCYERITCTAPSYLCDCMSSASHTLPYSPLCFWESASRFLVPDLISTVGFSAFSVFGPSTWLHDLPLFSPTEPLSGLLQI